MGRPAKRPKHESEPRETCMPILDPTSEIVTVRLGTGNSKIFQVHKDILTSTSQFFKAAVVKEWPPFTPRAIDLPRFEIEVFRCYVVWLYHRRITFANCEDDVSQWWEAVTNAYILGEELVDSTFKDAVMSMMMARAKHLFVLPIQEWIPQEPTLSTIRKVYAGTTESSKARQLCIEAIVEAISMERWASIKDELPMDLVSDVATFLLGRRGCGCQLSRLLHDPGSYYEQEQEVERRQE